MIKIEVWSDINCPFCYIGKRHLEAALKKFKNIQPVDLVWKSFELDPYSHPASGQNNTDYLARKYGKDRKWAEQMNQSMSLMAKRAGLNFHLENVIVANSFNAHRLIHLAKTEGLALQDLMVEKLFSCKFIEGKDIQDQEVLLMAGTSVGLNRITILEMLESEKFSYEVRLDEEVAGALGIRGVPHFVFNKHISISGARPVEILIKALKECDEFRVNKELE